MMQTSMAMLMPQQQVSDFSINDSSFVMKSINFVLNVKLNEYIFI